MASPGMAGGIALSLQYAYGLRHALLIAPRLYVPILGSRESHAQVTTTVGYRFSIIEALWRARFHVGVIGGTWFGDESFDSPVDLFLGGQLAMSIEYGNFISQIVLEGASLPTVASKVAAYPLFSAGILFGFGF